VEVRSKVNKGSLVNLDSRRSARRTTISRGNISDISRDGIDAIIVTFNARAGQVSYRYTGAAADQIENGADPSSFQGEQVSGGSSTGAAAGFVAASETDEAGEIGLLGLL
jgi:hypothetical protein